MSGPQRLRARSRRPPGGAGPAPPPRPRAQRTGLLLLWVLTGNSAVTELVYWPGITPVLSHSPSSERYCCRCTISRRKISALLFSWDLGCIAYLEYSPSQYCVKNHALKSQSPQRKQKFCSLIRIKGESPLCRTPAGSRVFGNRRIQRSELPAAWCPPLFTDS